MFEPRQRYADYAAWANRAKAISSLLSNSFDAIAALAIAARFTQAASSRP